MVNLCRPSITELGVHENNCTAFSGDDTQTHLGDICIKMQRLFKVEAGRERYHGRCGLSFPDSA